MAQRKIPSPLWRFLTNTGIWLVAVLVSIGCGALAIVALTKMGLKFPNPLILGALVSTLVGVVMYTGLGDRQTADAVTGGVGVGSLHLALYFSLYPHGIDHLAPVWFLLGAGVLLLCAGVRFFEKMSTPTDWRGIVSGRYDSRS